MYTHTCLDSASRWPVGLSLLLESPRSVHRSFWEKSTERWIKLENKTVLNHFLSTVAGTEVRDVVDKWPQEYQNKSTRSVGRSGPSVPWSLGRNGEFRSDDTVD